MSKSEEEAYNLLREAEKKKNYKGWFGGNKLDEAIELYQRAGNNFKLAKKWKEAGDAYFQAAGCQLQCHENDEAATSFVSASKCYKKTSPLEAIQSLQQAIQLLTERGRFQTAANHQKVIAEIYESDLIDIEKALEAYELASDWYAAEEASVLSTQCSLKAAHFCGELEQYEKAISIFEKAAANSIDNNLTKWSVKEYLLKAGICHLATNDLVATHDALERYCNMDMSFSETREYKFLENIYHAVEEGDIDAFTQHVANYDSLTKLDPWKTKLLLKIKKGMDEVSII